MGALAIIGAVATTASAGLEVYKSVESRNMEDEMAAQQSRQQMEAIKMQKTRATLSASESQLQRANQASAIFSQSKAVAAQKGMSDSPSYGAILEGSLKSYTDDNRMANLNLTMTNDDFLSKQLQDQRALSSQYKTNRFNMWEGIAQAGVSAVGNASAMAQGGSPDTSELDKTGAGMWRAINENPSAKSGDDMWSSITGTNEWSIGNPGGF